MAGIEFREIANRLTCEEFARRELPMKGNRAKCPFHGGEHYNLKFFRDGRCYCHTCHQAGDVVQLAAATWHVSQMDAARTLNRDFSLGVSDGGPDPALMKQRQQEQAAREKERQKRERLWVDSCDDLTSAINDFYVARAELSTYTETDMNTPNGMAALAHCLQAKAHMDEIWERMTGKKAIYDNDDGVFIDLLTGQVQADVG